jgi:hypothetical protein
MFEIFLSDTPPFQVYSWCIGYYFRYDLYIKIRKFVFLRYNYFFFMDYVVPMLFNSFTKCPTCLANILFFALITSCNVNHTFCVAGEPSFYLEPLFCYTTHNFLRI